MNLRQTAEVATLVATSAEHIVESAHPIPAASLHGYWKQSRTRLRCWFAALRSLQRNHTDTLSATQREDLIGLCREILVSEMLTRVWSTVLVAADGKQTAGQYRKTADGVFRGHLEARHEVLSLLAEEGPLEPEDQTSLDRFRRRIERWTDALLGPLLAVYGVDEFVFDSARASDFSTHALHGMLGGKSNAAMPLLLAGVTSAFPRIVGNDGERALLNAAIVRAILAAYPPDAFGEDGQLRSLEMPSGLPSLASTSTPSKRTTGGLSFVALRLRERRENSSGD